MKYLVTILCSVLFSMQLSAQEEINLIRRSPFLGINGNVESVIDTIFEVNRQGGLTVEKLESYRFYLNGLLREHNVYSPNGILIKKRENFTDNSGRIAQTDITEYTNSGKTVWRHKFVRLVSGREQWTVTNLNTGASYTSYITDSGNTQSELWERNGKKEEVIISYDSRGNIVEYKTLKDDTIDMWFSAAYNTDFFPSTIRLFYEKTNKSTKTYTYTYRKGVNGNWIEQSIYTNMALTGYVRRQINYR